MGAGVCRCRGRRRAAGRRASPRAQLAGTHSSSPPLLPFQLNSQARFLPHNPPSPISTRRHAFLLSTNPHSSCRLPPPHVSPTDTEPPSFAPSWPDLHGLKADRLPLNHTTRPTSCSCPARSQPDPDRPLATIFPIPSLSPPHPIARPPTQPPPLPCRPSLSSRDTPSPPPPRPTHR